MIRTAQVSFYRDPQQRGGAQLLHAWPTLLKVALAVRSDEVEVQVVQAAERTEEIECASVHFHFTPEPLQKLAEINPQLVHVHGLHFPRETRALRKLLPGVPVLVQDHAAKPARLRAPLYRWGLQHVSAVAVTAASQAELLRALLPEPVRVFEVPESSSDFTPGDQAAARELTGVYGSPALLWIGRLNEGKDPLTALNALALLTRPYPEAQLWCCYTEAPELPAIRQVLSNRPELQERVHLLGALPHDRVEKLCRAADVYISCSRYEGSGYALLEALACGLPPAVTDIPAYRALTADGSIGALAPCGDAEAMAGAIARVLALPAAEQRERVRAHFAQHLSFEVVGRLLRAAYHELVA